MRQIIRGSAIKSQFLAQTLGAPNKFKNLLIANKVTTQFLNSLCTSIFCTIKSNLTTDSKIIQKNILICILLLTGTVLCQADDRIELEKGAIIGNKEAPKAIYIVPWRPLTPVDIKGLEIGILLDEELELIDPETFRRQVELYSLTHLEQ